MILKCNHHPCFIALEDMKTIKEIQDEYWQSVDWSQSNSTIAAITGAAHMTVLSRRSKHAPEGLETIKCNKHNIDWDSFNWNKNNSMLSREHGINASLIRAERIRSNRGLATIFGTKINEKVSDEVLATVDWEFETDSAIGLRLGVTRERIRQIRSERQIAPARVEQLQPEAVSIVLFAVRNKELFNGKTLNECLALLPASKKTRPELKKLLARAGINPLFGLYPRKEKEKSHNWPSIN